MHNVQTVKDMIEIIRKKHPLFASGFVTKNGNWMVEEDCEFTCPRKATEEEILAQQTIRYLTTYLKGA